MKRLLLFDFVFVKNRMVKLCLTGSLSLIIIISAFTQADKDSVANTEYSAPENKIAPPQQAVEAGYNTLTFSDDFSSINTIDVANSKKTGFNWYVDPAIWGDKSTLPSAYSVSDSILTVSNSGYYTGNWTLASFSSRGNAGHKFRYGYFEARIRFDPALAKKGRGFPAWWSLSTYHSRVNNMDRWAELDFFEAYTSGYSDYDGAFVGTVHDWADSSKTHYQNKNNWQQLPKNTDFNQWHTYGCLWTPGKITWYFDDKPLMTQTYSATAYPSPLANGTTTPTPAGIFSILDTDPEGMLLILGSDTEWPIYVDWVRVWQAGSNDMPGTRWFTDARFGMFVHWGVYALPELQGESVHSKRMTYDGFEQLAKTFKPYDFDAAKIVSLAKNAGMKYLVITTKHHDGFCMWDTKLTDFNIVKWGGYNRDPIKELADECRKQGIKLGFYYSVRDWHHPDFVLHYEHLDAPGPNYGGWYAFPVSWTGGEVMDCGCSACAKNIPLTKEHDPRPTEAEGADMNRYLDYMKGQIKELLTNYGPVAVMWFDGQDIVDQKKGRIQEMIDEMRRLQPDVLINDRIAWLPGMGDYGVFEQNIPGSTIIRPWETCMTMNGTWGFSLDNHWKSTGATVRHLVDIVSKGGNFLLNIGPDPKGVVTINYESRLDSIGNWMKINSESIYGCGSSNLPQPKWGRITAKDNKLYLHIFEWPGDGGLMVENLDKIAKQAYLLNTEAKVSGRLSPTGLELSLPGKIPDRFDSVIVLEF